MTILVGFLLLQWLVVRMKIFVICLIASLGIFDYAKSAEITTHLGTGPPPYTLLFIKNLIPIANQRMNQIYIFYIHVISKLL